MPASTLMRGGSGPLTSTTGAHAQKGTRSEISGGTGCDLQGSPDAFGSETIGGLVREVGESRVPRQNRTLDFVTLLGSRASLSN